MDDLISRQAAIDELDKFIQLRDKALRSPLIASVDAYATKVERASLKHYREVLELLEPAQPERKTGKWIHQAKFGRIECDQCSSVYRNAFTPKNFCPNCGADMRGEDNGNK
jgi:rubrerythrin